MINYDLRNHDIFVFPDDFTPKEMIDKFEEEIRNSPTHPLDELMGWDEEEEEKRKDNNEA